MQGPGPVFISYSHDSPDHEAAVLALADRLRHEGIDAVLDQYQPFPPQGWIQWMDQQVERASFILLICTEAYCRRAKGEEEPGAGLGATYESRLIQQHLYNASGINHKFIPVILTAADRPHIPLPLQAYTYFQLDTEAGHEALYRLLTNQPKIQVPELGPKRALPALAARADFRNRVWNVPTRNPFFTGRETYLDDIHAALTSPRRAAALSGIGGIGKTQTAIEYAHRHRAEYSFALWATADEHAPLRSTFAALATVLDLPEKDEKDLNAAVRAVRAWLERNSNWLLILDNIDTPEDLNQVRELVPSQTAGALLLTTRLHAIGAVADPVELQKFDSEEGALFLLRRAKASTTDAQIHAAAVQISQALDGLPLALDQAGAFIEEDSTPGEYLELYQTAGAALRQLRGDSAPDHPSVTVTFSLAFTRLEQKNPPAADVARACAFLAPDAIPEEIFAAQASKLGESLAPLQTNQFARIEAFKDAGRLALLRRNPAAKTLDMHRQVQEVLKDGMDAPARRIWAERIVGALSAAFPYVEFKTWPQCERLLPHARAAARHIADFSLDAPTASLLLNQAATYLKERAEYPEAEPLFQRALAIREKTLGADHPATATSLNNLAALYDDQGHYERAEPLYQRALAIREKKLGADHTDTASTLNNLALVYGNQGRYQQAEPLQLRALAIYEKAPGTDLRLTANCLNNLALLYSNQGRYGEAEAIYQRALAIYEETLGADHPSTANCVNNLALLRHRQGRYDEAEPLYQRAIATREKTLGSGHPDTAVSLNNLAQLHRGRGHYEQAEPLYQRAIGILDKALGADHPRATIARANYAALLRATNREAEAQALEAQAKPASTAASQA